MNKKIDDYLRNHPYYESYKEENEQEVYAFSHKGKKIFLCLDKNFDATNSSFPLVPLDEKREYISNFWKMPKWFKEIEIKANELYFEAIRLKLLMQNERRKFHNILFYHSYEEKEGKGFWEAYANNNFSKRQNYRLPVSYRPILERANEKIELGGYELGGLHEKEAFLYFDIIIKERGGKTHVH